MILWSFTSYIKVKYEHFQNYEYPIVCFVLLPRNGDDAQIQDSNMHEPTASEVI